MNPTAPEHAALLIEALLRQVIADKLSLEPLSIGSREAFFSLGVTSLVSEEIRADLDRHFDGLSSTVLFEQPNIERLCRFLAARELSRPLDEQRLRPLLAQLEARNAASAGLALQEPPAPLAQAAGAAPALGAATDGVAVIGISARLPRAANPREFWRNLLDRIDCVDEVPPQRWDAQTLYELRQDGSGIRSKWGGFIDGVEHFDPLFFRISHKEAEQLDPQQKLFLQCAWEVMEDAGYGNAELRPSQQVGVFVGVTWNEFSLVAQDAGAQQGGGSLYWGIPNRVSYCLNLNGPSQAIDTACSSSLVAIHNACASVLSGESEMAIAGGVNLNLHPAKYRFLSQNHFLSSEGKCRSFGEGGDGYVPGEGVVALLLKPLSKALADGDHVYGVIRGSATNHGGKVTGYTVPNPQAHTELVRTALQRAALAPELVDYIECHGTGTELGDPIEIRGLCGAFGHDATATTAPAPASRCWVGSVKSNIGHLEAAAGAAGVVKVLLSMQHDLLPAGLHAETVNRKIAFEHSPFALLQSHQPWTPREGRGTRVAGVSSFGAGGTNAHLVLESLAQGRRFDEQPGPHWIALSAQSGPQLLAQARQLGQFLQETVLAEGGTGASRPAWSLSAVAFTLSHGRQHFPHRLLLRVQSLGELAQRLLACEDLEALPAGVLTGVVGEPAQASAADADATALAWITGASDAVPDAAQLPPCRVPLPTYPFLRERSWPTQGPVLVTEALLAQLQHGEPSAALHPLIDANVSTLRKQQFRKRLLQSDYYLKDHLVALEHVVPGVCHLELAMAAAQLALDAGAVLIREVWFTNVIAVRQASREVSITLQPRESWVEYAISAEDDGTPFSRGRLVHQAAEAMPRAIDLDAVRATLTHEWEIPAVYQRFGRSGVIQKRTFQVLKRLQFTDPAQGLALARLSLDASLAADFGRYTLHPTLMDGAVQTAMMLLQFCLGREIPILPIHFGSVRRLQPLQPEVQVHCQLRHLDGKRFDLDITDLQGQVLVEIRDFILKEMKDGKPSTEARLEGANPLQQMSMDEGADVPLYVPCWQDEALPAQPVRLEELLVLGGEVADVEALKSSPELAGARVLWVQWQAGAATAHEDRWCVDPEDASALASVVDQIHAQGLPSRVLLLSADEGAQALEHPGRTVFLLTQALLPRAKQLQLLVHCSGRRAEDLALGGFFKTLRVERPSFKASVLRSACERLDARLASALCREFQQADSAVDLRLQDGQRSALRWQRQAARHEATEGAFKRGGVYLVTGGMGGLGRIMATHLSSTLQARVYLVGRSALQEEKAQQLQALQGLGGQVHYLPCDIADLSAVQALVGRIQAEAGRLDGVLHAAGVIEDAFILKKPVASFDRTTAPKVLGTRNLDLATAALPLDLFVVFSSVTAILGNVGQCDYGYGNAYADHFCHARAAAVQAGQRRGRSLSVNWPFWAEGGMSLTEREQQALAKGFGIHPLGTADGLQALSDALAGPDAQVAVLKGDARRIAQVLGLPAGAELGSAPRAQALAKASAVRDEGLALPARIESYLKDLLSTQLKIPRERLKVKESFDQYGLDSIAMIELIGAMEGRFENLPKTLFFEHQSIADLVDYFAEHHAEAFAAPEAAAAVQEDAPPMTAPVDGAASRFLDEPLPRAAEFAGTTQSPTGLAADEPIAIIGLAGQYPHAATLDEFWRDLCAGRDCVETVPAERWAVDDYWEAADGIKSTGEGKSYARWGSFLRDVDCFDAAYFNITPKEAAVLDPQERLFLECVNAAIEDAGYRPDCLDAQARGKEHRVGVYAGSMWGEYQLLGQDQGGRFDATPQSFAWSLANRVSYFFNFSGPSLTVDTACSSSFTALKLACDALRRGEVAVAIAGAVNLSLHPQKYALLSRMKFLSTDGRCRSFGEGGDGYVPGEGLGAVVLKPLSAALRDRDHIHGVIRAGVLNHGGRTSGFTVPNPVAQGRLVSQAIEQSGLSAADLDYVEAHGTGTDLGDPVEVAGLSRAFAGVAAQAVPIGSVKANYGHLEAAAGMIALTKVLLQFRHGTLVPSIHSQPLNPKIGFEKTPFRVQQACQPWPQRRSASGGTLPRRAGISSFGAGGANAHFVVEEAPALPQQAADSRPQLMMYSARTPQALQALLERHARFLADRMAGGTAPGLADMAYTLCVGRVPLACRVAFVADSLPDLLARLQALAQDLTLDGVASSQDPQSRMAAELADDAQLLQRWAADRQLERLARVWAGGMELDAGLLFDAARCRRVPLPSYAHERQRHWVEVEPAGAAGARVRPRLHAWLDENVSTLSQHAFRKVFEAGDVWLREHRVQDRATLPGVLMLEMARAAVQSAADQPLHSLQALRWLSPVQPADGPVELRLRLLPQGDEGWFEIASAGQAPRRVHAYGRYLLGAATPQPVAQDLDALRRSLQPAGNPAHEDALAELGLAFGSSYRVSADCWRGKDAVLVSLQRDPAAAACGDLPHPGLLDGALRAALAIAPGPLRFAQVPVALAQYRVHGPIAERCFALAREVEREGQRQFDVQLLDDQGRCSVEFLGLQLQPLMGAAKVKPAARPQAEEALGALPAAADLAQVATDFLRQAVAEVTKLPPAQVPLEQAFPEMGIDSLMVMELNDKLENALGPLSKTLFYEHAHVRDMACYLAQEHADAVRCLAPATVAQPASPEAAAEESTEESAEESATDVNGPLDAAATTGPRAEQPTLPYEALLQGRPDSGSQEPIAVIGFAGSFPQAEDAEAFWQRLREGVDCIEEVPASRWNHAAFHVPGTSEPGKVSAKWGGFVPNVDRFDAPFFQIPPVMAKQIDPQERLFLQTAWSAMESAGYTPAAMEDARSRLREVGVFVGFMWSHYGLIEGEEHLKGQPAVGITWNSSIANRVSHFCDFKGPSFVVDIACASSLMAVHLACESLRRGECRYAIAGGVNLTLHPSKYRTLTQMGMLASDGRCRSFGEGGSGYVPGEGVGAVLLKPLSQARRDGDTVYMTILASAVNHGGRSNGYTVPSPDAQSRCIEKALELARVDAREVSYVETHGTGTVLGDPIEVSGMSKAFRKQTGDRQFCAIGSVKSNIGHLESAAGIASLIKVLQQMRHGQLAPSLHTARLNPNIDFEASPFRVQRELQDWPRPLLASGAGSREVPRTALINSFAAGGTNTILVVREPETQPHAAAPAEDAQPQLVVLSAKRRESLMEQVARLRRHLDRTQPALADLAYTLQVGREAMSHRLAWVVDSVEALRLQLDQALQSAQPRIVSAVPAAQPEAVQGALRACDLDRLAALWLEGQVLPWAALHQGRRRQRLALPTYAFATERHWMEIKGGAPGVLCAPELQRGVQALHPLLDRNVSSFEGLAFSKQLLAGDEQLTHVQQRGRWQLPAGALLEMMRAGGQLAGRKPLRGLRSLRCAGQPVGDGQDLTLLLRQEAGRSHGRISAQGPLEDASAAALIEAELLYGQPSLPALRLDIEAVHARCTAELAPAQLYAQLQEQGLSLAPSACLIEQVRLRPGELLARLKLPTLGGAWADVADALHPLMAEWVLMAAWALLRQAGRTVAPVLSALDQLQLGIQPREACWLHVRLDGAQRASVDIYDAQRLLRQRWLGLELGKPGGGAGPGRGLEGGTQRQHQPAGVPALAASSPGAVLGLGHVPAPWAAAGEQPPAHEPRISVLGLAHVDLRDGALDLERLELDADEASLLNLAQRQWLEAVEAALGEALCSRDAWRRHRSAIIVASPGGAHEEGRGGELAQLARRWTGGPGPTIALQAAGQGGSTALELGVRTLQSGGAELALVGQADAQGAWALVLGVPQAVTVASHGAPLWLALDTDKLAGRANGAGDARETFELLPSLQQAWADAQALESASRGAAEPLPEAELLRCGLPGGGWLRLGVPACEPVGTSGDRVPCLLPVSAVDADGLRAAVQGLQALLSSRLEQGLGSAAELRDLAFSLQMGRDALRQRAVFLAEDPVDLLQLLQRFQADESHPSVWTGVAQPAEAGLAAELFSGPLGADMVAALLARGDHATLARLWTQGLAVDWSALYRALPAPAWPGRHPLPAQQARRRALPLPDQDLARFAHPAAVAEVGRPWQAQLHPMIDSNASTLWRYAFNRRFTGSEFYLHDHLVQGQPVLPGVAYLEMARFAGQSASPVDHVAKLANVMWMTPMEVSRPLDVVVELLPQDDHVAFEIFSTPAAEQHIVHAQGEIHYAEIAPAAPPRVDIAALKSRLPMIKDQATLYGQFERMGYGYGPSFVATQSLRFGADEALGELRVPADLVETSGELALHPSLLDAALRSTLGLDERFQRGDAPLVLPFSLGQLRIHRMLTPSCYAYVTREPGSTPSFPKFRIQLLNMEGEVLVDIADFAARQVRSVQPNSGYYQASWTLPARALELRPLDAGPLLLWSDDAALHEALRQQPPMQGRPLIVVRSGAEFRQMQPLSFELDPARSEHVRALFERLAAQQTLPTLIVHALGLVRSPSRLQPVEGAGALESRLQSLETDLELGLRSLLRIYQACRALAPDLEQRCLYVYPHSTEMTAPQHEMVAAFGKSLTSLSPKFMLGSLSLDDVAVTNRQLAAQSIVQELSARSFAAGSEARCVMGARLVRRILPYTHAGGEALQLAQGAVVLVTGGLGKLGRVFCRYLASRTQARIAILGRSPATAETATFLQALQELGAPQALYLAADSADVAAMRAAVLQARERLGPIQGVLHCAGMVSTIPASEVSQPDFDRVLQAKLHGTLILDEVTRDQPLDYFLLFSSLSALVGDFGYGNYAAANRFLDGFAQLRQLWYAQGERPGETLSLGWPLWEEGGMEIPPQDRALYFTFSGMEALSNEQGLQAFEQMLRFRQGQLAVVHGDVERIHRVMQIQPEDGGRHPARPGIRAQAPSPCDSAMLDEREGQGGEDGAAASADVLLGGAQGLVRGLLSETLEIPVEQLQDAQPFEAYGMDSVLIMKMSKRLQDKLGELPKTALFEYNSVADLAAYLARDRAEALGRTLGLQATAQSAPARAAPSAVPAAGTGEPAPDVSLPLAARPDPIAAIAPADDGSKAVGERALRRWSQAGRPAQPLQWRGAARSALGVAGTPSSAALDDPIAIVGLAGRYPRSPDLDSFWRHAVAGVDVTGEIPAERWDAARFFSEEGRAANGRSRSRWGGFLEEVEHFDAAFFRMTPEQAGQMDPQLRLALENAWHAVEDAGYTPEALRERRVGVYLGVQYADYGWVAAESYLKTGRYAGPGCMPSELANQVSSFMDFRGPSLTVETGCSSALTALHLARRAIHAGDCDCALAGAVNLSLHPGKYLMLDGLKVLSPQGRERPFDESADGYVPSEGVGTVLLKRLSQAELDGDHIYGLLAGSSVNHAGRGAGQYLPNIRQLEACFGEALQDAGLKARQLQYIECHGTGTELGDPIELKALVNRLQAEQAPAGGCVVSTKGNFGHLEAASGMCSLTKVLLAMRHGQIPPCAHLDQLNKAFDADTLPLRLSGHAQPWPDAVGGPAARMAGINSFGLGGSNAFLIVEAAPEVAREPELAMPEQLWVLSARSAELLRAQAQALCRLAQAPAHTRPRALDAVHTLQQGRVAHAQRLAVMAAGWEELAALLQDWLDGREDGDAVVSGRVPDLPGARAPWQPAEQGQERRAVLLHAARAWVQGATLPWADLLGALHPRRASLPLTLFDRQPCLLDGRRLAEIQALPALHGLPAEQQAVSASAAKPPAKQDQAVQPDEGWPACTWEAGAKPLAAAARKYWRQRYASALNLPALPQQGGGQPAHDAADAPASLHQAEGRSQTHGWAPVHLDAALREGLRRLGWQEGLCIETLLAAAWTLVLARQTQSPQAGLLLDTGRRCLFSVLPAARRGSTVDWMRSLQEQLTADAAHAAPDAAAMSLWLPRLARLPAAPAALLLHDAGEAPRSLARTGLALCVARAEAGPVLALAHDLAQHGPEQVQALAEQLQLCLQQMLEHPRRNPAAISLQSRQEQRERFWARLDTDTAGVPTH